MKPFPALFYFACIILLGVRLRPLHHLSSTSYATSLTAGASASALWWQKELNLWFGWTNDLVTTLIKWLRTPNSSLSIPIPIPHLHLPLPTTTTGKFNFNFPWPLWKVANGLNWQSDGTRNVVNFLALPTKVASSYSHPVNGLLKLWPWSWSWTWSTWTWTHLSGWSTFVSHMACFGDTIRLVALGTLTYVGLTMQYLITSIWRTITPKPILELPQIAANSGPGQV